MRSVRVNERLLGDFRKKFLTRSDYDELIDESCEVLGPDGERRFLLLKNALDPQVIRLAWHAISRTKFETDNRSTASGAKMQRKVRADGSLSNSQRTVEKVQSGVIGYFDRYPRIPFCRKCAWNQKHPDLWNYVLPLAADVSREFERAWPEKYAIQKNFEERTHKDFVIPGTVYTTITVNKNYRTACHLDPKNIPNSVSNMLVIHDGRIKGGDLVLPEYRLAFKLGHGDLVFFDGTKEWHGNTPVTKLSAGAVRCSLVFYFRNGMVNCGSHAEELARAKSENRNLK